ncbi:unnamed protein product [Effrenium voratum]|nr:unnamed protein product [Effrenium voratum]
MEGEPVAGEPVPEASPGQKMCNAFGLMCTGIICLPLALLLLGSNEKSYVCTHNSIFYADQKAKVLQCNQHPSAVQDGAVFMACPIQQDSLQTFSAGNLGATGLGHSVSVRSAAAAAHAEMFQCVESYKTQTQGKTKVKIYSYSMQWSTYPIDSSDFSQTQQAQQARANQCPGFTFGNPEWPMDVPQGTETRYADQVRAGPLTIDKALLRGGSASGLGVNMGRPLNLQNFSKAFKNFDSLPGLPAHAMHHGVQARVHALSLTSVTPNVAAVDMAGTSLVTCQMPRLGCLKIQFFKNWESSVSLMTAVQSGYTVPVDVPASWGCSPDKYQALEGGISSKQAFSTMLEEANTTSTWMMRFLGLCFAWIAVYCCFQPISASIDVVGDCLRIIPCVGGLLEDLLEGMVTCLLCVVSCCCGCSLGFLVIALMWLYMRPLIGGGLLAICLVLGIGGYFLAYQNKVNRPARTLEQGSELQKLNEPKDNAA